MSKYSKYGRRLDELMRRRFADFEKIEAEYKRAKRNRDECPVRQGIVTQEYQLKSLKYDVAYKEAEEAYKEALKALKRLPDEARAIRSALYEELRKDLSAKPEDLDEKVVALLTSGVCTPQEVNELFTNAETLTTKRFISQFADKVDCNNMRSADAMMYKKVANAGRRLYDPEEHDALQKFDVAVEMVNRCSNNPGMIGYWGQLTETPLSEM